MTLVAAAKSSAVARYGSAKQYLREVRERKRDAKKRYKQIKTVAKQKHLTYTKPELLLTCLGSNTLGTEQYGGEGEQRLPTAFNGFVALLCANLQYAEMLGALCHCALVTAASTDVTLVQLFVALLQCVEAHTAN